jgi:Putative porin
MKANKQSNAMKLALVSGALVLTAFAPQAHAQSADALIDKLVDKGILTADEAKDLRDQADNDFKTAFSAKTGMPDWVTGYKISGDVRGRFEQFSGDNNALIDRTRLRYRVRFGVAVNMLDNMEAGLRLGSGDPTKINNATSPTGNPVSANTTMQDNFSRKMVYIDTAYGKWTALNSGNWLLAATVGKMDNPFTFTPMVFDPDITPEGAALTGGYVINDKHSIAFAGAAFVMDEEQNSTHDPLMFGGQVIWNAKWTDKWASSLGIGALSIVNAEQLTTANVPYVNEGNTRQAVVYTPPFGSATTLYTLKNQYNPIIANASVTYTADTFPYYAGAFPIKVAGEFINNPGANQNNNGYWLGVTFGKSGAKKTWDLTYRYEYLEGDAWYDQMVDDDNGAYFPGDVAALQNSGLGTAGYYGGTNVKGHMVKLNYSLTDSLTFTVTCFVNNLISLDGLSPNVAVADRKMSSAIHFMADMMWKF